MPVTTVREGNADLEMQMTSSSRLKIKTSESRLQIIWAKYVEGLLNIDDPEETFDLSAYEVSEELDINRDELDKAISLLKRNKAPGVDKITSEILKDGGDAVRESLLRIRQLTW